MTDQPPTDTPRTDQHVHPPVCDWCGGVLEPQQAASNGGCDLCDVCRHIEIEDRE